MHSTDGTLPGAVHQRVAQDSTSVAAHIVQKLRQPSRLRGRLLCAVFGIILYACAFAARGHQVALRRYVAASVKHHYLNIPYSETSRWKEDDETSARNGTDAIKSFLAESWEQIMVDPDKISHKNTLEGETLTVDDGGESGLANNDEDEPSPAQESGKPGLQKAENIKIAEELEQVETSEKTQNEKSADKQNVGDKKELGHAPIVVEDKMTTKQENIVQAASGVGDESKIYGTKTSDGAKTESSGVAYKIHGSNEGHGMKKAEIAAATVESNRTEDGRKAAEKERFAKGDAKVSEKASIGAELTQGGVMTYEPELVGDIDQAREKTLAAEEEMDIFIEQDTSVLEPDTKIDEPQNADEWEFAWGRRT